MDKETIELISKHSNWSEKGVKQALQEHIYPNKTAWQKFLALFLMSAGVSFSVLGIVFFFAYNWADLHKFAKLGLIQFLVLALIVGALFLQENSNLKNILLTAACVLVGVLFAVFGQIYQTGADAYALFLTWTLLIAVWVLVANFLPLWLIFIILINLTFDLYVLQVDLSWSPVFILTLHVVFYAVILTSIYFLSNYRNITISSWFTKLMALAVVFFATYAVLIEIIDEKFEWSIFYLLGYLAVMIYVVKYKHSFYLAIIAVSLILLASTQLIMFIDISLENLGSLFIVALFIILSTTFLIKYLLQFQRESRQ